MNSTRSKKCCEICDAHLERIYVCRNALNHIPTQFVLLYVMLYDKLSYEEAISIVLQGNHPLGEKIYDVRRYCLHNEKFKAALDVVTKCIYDCKITQEDLISTREYLDSIAIPFRIWHHERTKRTFEKCEGNIGRRKD